MKKKIALVLVLVMLVNSITWAAGEDEEDLGTGFLLGITIVFLAAIIVAPIIGSMAGSMADAGAPDDGLRLVSMANPPSFPKTGLKAGFKVLQPIDLELIRENKAYFGFRLQF
jgi:hypothetical protein